MKRLDSRNTQKLPQARLVLNRETLRRLEAREMEQVAGGLLTQAASCFPCVNPKSGE